ncbi:MAG: hypothetical protein FWG44_02165 [Oscillospiraceae bacterium]|nr:hypothetical protein [Oscillospiraceae bacterium]
MILKNNYDNREINLKFCSDEQAVPCMLDCLRSVYGKSDNYVNPKMFESKYIIENIQQGNIDLFGLITENGESVAAAAVKKNPYFEKAREISGMAVSEGYRGFHTATAFSNYIVKQYENKCPLYAHVVMFSAAAAKSLEDNGFIPTGFIYGVADAKKHLSQLNYKSLKHSWAIYIKSNSQTVVNLLYVPERFAEFICGKYAEFGIKPSVQSSVISPPETSRIKYEQDVYHKTLYIYISVSGSDLREKVSEVEKKYNDRLQTVVLFLNINDAGAVWGFETLSESGYKFTGMKPFCGEFEYIVFAKMNHVFFDMSELKMTDSLKQIFERIGQNLSSRKISRKE